MIFLADFLPVFWKPRDIRALPKPTDNLVDSARGRRKLPSYLTSLPATSFFYAAATARFLLCSITFLDYSNRRKETRMDTIQKLPPENWQEAFLKLTDMMELVLLEVRTNSERLERAE